MVSRIPALLAAAAFGLALTSSAANAAPPSRKLDGVGINVGNSAWTWSGPMPQKAADALGNSGAGWVRMTLPWVMVQPSQDKPENWAAYDQIVSGLRARKLNIVFTLSSTPCWARADQSLSCKNPRRLGYIPRRDLWQTFVGDAVRHFKGQVTYWEVWNEPNYDKWFHIDKVNDNAENRFSQIPDALLIPAAQAIHEANPDAKVVGPTIAAAAFMLSPDDFARRLKYSLGHGAAKLLDVVSIHVYPPGDPMEYGKAARQVMADLGIADRPLWLTETGVALEPPGFFTRSTDPAQALAALVKTNFAARSPIYDKIFWFALNDLPGPHAKYGLVDDDGTPRPSFETLQGLTNSSAIP